MGFFSKILDKLGMDAGAGKVDDMLRTPVAPSAPSTATSGAGAATATAAAKPATQVDVTAQLEQKAAANAQKLNWRTSIVDLLKLLDLDSSLDAQGTGQGTRLPAQPDGRLGADEHLAAQGGDAETRGQRRQGAGRTPALS